MGVSLSQNMLHYQILVALIYGCAFDALHIQQKQRLPNLGVKLMALWLKHQNKVDVNNGLW